MNTYGWIAVSIGCFCAAGIGHALGVMRGPRALTEKSARLRMRDALLDRLRTSQFGEDMATLRRAADRSETPEDEQELLDIAERLEYALESAVRESTK